MFQKTPKTLDVVTHKYLSWLLIGSMCLLISCGNQQVSEPSSTTSVSITTTTETLPPISTTSTVPFDTWFKSASLEEMCAKVKEIWRTEAHWTNGPDGWTDEMTETYYKVRVLLAELDWDPAYFIYPSIEFSSVADKDRATDIVWDFLRYGYGGANNPCQ